MDEGRRILVIDDEEIVHSSIRRILTRLGYAVDCVFTANDGLSNLQHNDYDAVITDLMMPEMNGIEMLHAMKERNLAVPTIMITGYPTIKTAIQALRLGAVDYIPKPFTRQELLSPLSRALRRGEIGPPEISDAQEETEAKRGEQLDLLPGDCFYLPEHSWALYNQDGTIDIGIEAGFLSAIGKVAAIETPPENDLIEQGHPGITINVGSEVHGVFMPLSGRVVKINGALVANPVSINAQTWVLKIIPSQLHEELASLRRRAKCGI